MTNIRPNTLNVTAQTTLNDLQGFASKAGEDHRVRGRMVDGQLQLYSKPDSNRFGVLSKLSPSAIYHRHLGQAAMAKVFDNHASGKGGEISEALTSKVKTPVAADLKAGVLNLVSGAAQFRAIHKDNPDEDYSTPGPGSDRLGVATPDVLTKLGEAALTIKNGGDLSKVTGELGELLLAHFEASSPSEEERRDFSTSLGEEPRKAMLEFLKDFFEPDNGSKPSAKENEALQSLAAGAFNHAAANVLADRFLDANTFRLDGNIFKTDPSAGPLGQGGFGVVHKFAPADGPAVAVKVMHPTNDVDLLNAKTNEALREIKAHRAVEGEGHPNVTQMKGALRLPGGGFAIILELASHGTLKGFAGKISDAVKAGAITPEQGLLAERSAARDMLQALDHSHRMGMVNQDVKDENFLITGDGTIKLADNGAAREIGSYDFTTQGISTPAYLSPEAVETRAVNRNIDEVMGDRTTPSFAPTENVPNHEAERGAFTGAPSSQGNATRTAVEQMIDRQLPNLPDDEKRSLADDYIKGMSQQLQGRQLDPMKRDGYAGGLAVRAMVYEKGPEGADPIPRGGDRAALRGLVDGMTEPNVMKRLSPTEAMNHPAVKLTDSEIADAKAIIVKVGNWSKAEATKVQTLPMFQTSFRGSDHLGALGDQVIGRTSTEDRRVVSQLDHILSNFNAGEARSSALGTSAADAAEGIAEAEATLRENGREDVAREAPDRSLDHQMNEVVNRADALARQLSEGMERARNGSLA